MIKRFVSLLVVSFASSYSQQSQPTGAAAAPAARPASFATVTALTRAVLDSKSCVSGKEFRISITSSFVFSSEAIEDDAEFVGHIQACNHDDKGRLSKAVVLIDSLSLQKGKILPITAVLQALGPVPQPRFTEYGYLTWEKLEKSGAAPFGIATTYHVECCGAKAVLE